MCNSCEEPSDKGASHFKVMYCKWCSQFKDSAQSFQRFTSRPNLKICFSLYAPITSDEGHTWFHLNAASPTERNTNKWTLQKSCPWQDSNPQDSTASRLHVDRLHHSVNSPTLRMKVLNSMWYVLLCISIRSIITWTGASTWCVYNCHCSLAVPWYNIWIVLQIDQWDILLLFLTIIIRYKTEIQAYAPVQFIYRSYRYT